MTNSDSNTSSIVGTHTSKIHKYDIKLNSGSHSKKERAYITLESEIPDVGDIKITMIFISSESDLKDWEQRGRRFSVYLSSDILTQSIELLKRDSGTSFTISNSPEKYFRLNHSNHK